MQRNESNQGFNKEKLAFLATALLTALGTYWFLSSGPVMLDVGEPIASQPPPATVRNASAENPLPENFFVVDGALTRLLDPRTSAVVNRERKTPFAPARGWKDNANTAAKVAVGPPPTPPPPPPPAPPAPPKVEKAERKSWDAADIQSEVEFMGVVTTKGERYGLLKPKDGSAPQRVKVGDVLAQYKYTITKIESQAIHIVDEDKHPFVIRDQRFADEAAVSTSSTRKKADADDAEAEEKPKKKLVTPPPPAKPSAPKPAAPKAAAPAATAVPTTPSLADLKKLKDKFDKAMHRTGAKKL